MNDLMQDQDWALAEQLARELAKNRVSHNLLRSAVAYFRWGGNSVELLEDWLQQLGRLGDKFASGDEIIRERITLVGILTPQLQKYPQRKWGYILGWTARLMQTYTRSSNTSANHIQSRRRR